MNESLNEREVSRLTGMSLTTLRRDRTMGRGIPYIKYRKSVFYRLSDVEAYIERHRVTTIDDPRPPASAENSRTSQSGRAA